MFRKLRLRLRAWFRRDEIGDEFALHLEQLTDEFIARGLTPEEARAAAKRQFGNVTRVQEQSRRLFSFGLLEDLLQDLHYGWRGLRRTPSVAIAAVLSMGLAIGVNTVVFSLIQEIFFSKPTTRGAADLVTIGLGGSSHSSLANLRDLDASGNFDKVAGFDIETTVNWRRGDEVRQTPVMLVSENYFELLETRPEVGRVFGSREARAELNPHFVVITHRLWTRAFGQDPTVAGRTLVLNGRPYSVLGVLPAGFRPPTFLNTLPDLYVPASPELKPSLLMRQSHALMLIARLRPGQSVAQAQAALRVVAGRMARDYPKENGGLGRSVRLRAIGAPDPDQAPLIAFAALVTVAVFVVLWIACVNVAGVLIARAASRRREIAIRLAIGAGRGRLVRQLLAEALLLASLGTIGGLGVHWYLTKLLNEMSLPVPVPIVFQMEPNLGLVLYAIALTVVAAILSGLLPALQATRPALSSALKLEDSQPGRRQLTLRNSLLVAQVAVTTVLLSVALLFTRSLARAHSVNPGFDLQHTVWAKVTVVNDRYPRDQVFRFASRALDAAAAVPGVQSAALSQIVPFNNFMKVGTEIQTGTSTIKAEYFGNSVSPAYFETLGIPILAGRPFSAGDRKGSQRVVILNLALSRRLFGDRSAVGERIWFGNKTETPDVEVVGVAANSKYLTMGENQANAVYEPFAQTQPAKAEINVFARAATGAESVIVGLREALSSLDDTAAVEVGALRNRLAFAYLPTQIGAVFVGCLGAAALLLALIGIYGTMAFAVSRRTAEIGIRMALGASTGQVLKSILGASLGTMCIGIAIGIVLAVGAAHPLAFFLAEGITPMDPVTFASVILICVAAGGIAAIIPARRALSIDPMSALRIE